MMKENDLIEKIEVRNSMMDNIHTLEKVKELITFSGTDYISINLVSEFYEVPDETINTIYKRNIDEFKSDGVVILSKLKVEEEIQKVHGELFESIKIPNRGMKLFTKRGMLRMGMLLTESIIAKEVRTQLLNGFDNSVENGQVENFTKDIDEEKQLVFNVGMAMAEGDMDKFTKANFELNEFRKRKIDKLNDKVLELTDENSNLRKFLGNAETFTKKDLAEKLDTHTNNMAKILKEIGVYTPHCKVKESFKDKYQDIKITVQVETSYIDKDGITRYKKEWQWTKEGAFEVIKYLKKLGRVSETENGEFKIKK